MGKERRWLREWFGKSVIAKEIEKDVKTEKESKIKQ